MTRAVSSRFRSALFAQETAEVFLVLLEIHHEELVDPIRLSSDSVNTTSNGQLYIAYPFEIGLPDDPAEGIPRAKLRVDNVHRSIVEAVRRISTPPKVHMLVVLADNPDVVEVSFPHFLLTNVQYDAETVSGDLTLESLEAEPYPGDSFLPSTFPGIF
jgi:hypothetical protein